MPACLNSVAVRYGPTSFDRPIGNEFTTFFGLTFDFDRLFALS